MRHTSLNQQEFLTYFLQSMEFHTILRMIRQGRNFWGAYMSTTERILDTTMAVVRQRLRIEPPYLSDIRTHDAKMPNDTYFLPTKRLIWRHSSSTETNFRWNNLYHPWEKTPFQFSLELSKADMVGFPKETTQKLDLEKFTIITYSYKRLESIHDLLVGLRGLDKMDRVQ